MPPCHSVHSFGKRYHVVHVHFCCIQDFLLPDHSPAAAHKLLASMLSAPPPHTVADATRKAVRALCKQQSPDSLAGGTS